MVGQRRMLLQAKSTTYYLDWNRSMECFPRLHPLGAMFTNNKNDEFRDKKQTNRIAICWAFRLRVVLKTWYRVASKVLPPYCLCHSFERRPNDDLILLFVYMLY